jgi:hypothetical protein
MGFDVINIGATANDGTGDPLRTAFDKTNDNFALAVEGPATATSGRVAVYDGATGKLLRDGTKAEADLVVGPAAAATNNVAVYADTTGKVVKDSGVNFEDLVSSSYTWTNGGGTSPAATVPGGLTDYTRKNLYDRIKGCVLNADGTLNYYLNPTNWAEKEAGGASDLTGTDGNVMVEIPKFYYRVRRNGNQWTWSVSPVALAGFALHPAFTKDGVDVDFRYYGAYSACVFDVSASAYLSGLNWDNNSGANGVGVDVTATTGDKLASVSGVYPMAGLTRAEFRTIGANVGAGWRQLDFHLWQAVGLLYLVEYQTFYNQVELGAGNTNGTYFAPSGDQNDSPNTIAGAGNSWANGSTDGSQPSAGAKPGTAYVRYRGIENLFGNGWNWADGININVTATGNVHVTNNAADWADNTATNYTLISSSLTTGSENIRSLLAVDPWFLAASTGGSSAQYVTDRHAGNALSNRVASVGGNAAFGGNAGVFALNASSLSSLRDRFAGGRLAR